MLQQLGVDYVSGNLLTELSRGQLQRVLIGGAAIKQPRLLVFDEPTSALDVDSRNTFVELCLGLYRTSRTHLCRVRPSRAGSITPKTAT